MKQKKRWETQKHALLSSTKICDVGKCHRYKTKSKYPPKGEWVFSLAFNMLTNKYLL